MVFYYYTIMYYSYSNNCNMIKYLIFYRLPRLLIINCLIKYKIKRWSVKCNTIMYVYE